MFKRLETDINRALQ